MPIKTKSDLIDAYTALRQAVDEHPNNEPIKQRFEVVFGELRERRAKAIRERDSRIPLICVHRQ